MTITAVDLLGTDDQPCHRAVAHVPRASRAALAALLMYGERVGLPLPTVEAVGAMFASKGPRKGRLQRTGREPLWAALIGTAPKCMGISDDVATWMAIIASDARIQGLVERMSRD